MGRRKAIAAAVVLTTVAVALATVSAVLASKTASAASPGGPDGSAETLINPPPPIAGNLPKFNGVDFRPVNLPLIAPFRARFETLFDPRQTGNPRGLYGMPGLADPVTGGVSWVMYEGHNEPAGPGDPVAMVNRLMRVLGSDPSWATSPGLAGGSARCMHTRYNGVLVAVCGWATACTIGAVMSPARTTGLAELATLMREMRPDLAGFARPASFP